MNTLETSLEQRLVAATPKVAPDEIAPEATTLRGGVWTQYRRGWLSGISLLGLLALWWGLSHSGIVPPLFLPAPEAVLAKLVTVSTQGFMDATLWQHLAASLQRIVLALLAAVLLGIPLGVLMGVSPVARGLLDPLIEAYRPVPPLAYLPLIVIWFGIGELSKVLLIFLAVLAPVIIATSHGVAQVSRNRLRAAQTLGASRSQLLWLVILPEHCRKFSPASASGWGPAGLPWWPPNW